MYSCMQEECMRTEQNDVQGGETRGVLLNEGIKMPHVRWPKLTILMN